VAETITILDPTAERRETKSSTSPRIQDLNDQVLGFLWNSKPNGDILLQRIKELLDQDFRIAGSNWYEKPIASIPADAATIEAMAKDSDLLINAIGD
jgi:hypothetical protein